MTTMIILVLVVSVGAAGHPGLCPQISPDTHGTFGWGRTSDLLRMKELLCQLSYKGILGWTAELESATSWATTRRSNPTELRPHGDYEGTRTPDLQRDRLALYATELHSHIMAGSARLELATP